jgi:ABC-type taurine transport system ATPase subunit
VITAGNIAILVAVWAVTVAAAGSARSFVVHPDPLLMNEPFSALDVLTVETLCTNIIYLWIEGHGCQAIRR